MNLVHSGRRLLCILILAASAVSLSGAEPAVRRYGLFVGANDGGRGRVLLRYAGSDAEMVASTLQRIGGLDSADTILLKNPTGEQIKQGIAAIETRISASKSSGKREEFIFYYSGHSDEEGLLIGEERLEYLELRDRLKEVDADVHIAILDSCSSGVFTRLKGGVRRSPFLFDESTKAAGHAFLTSSSENEAAQESDELGGSFFTHYFLAALSGAADTSRDSRVSLNEAYAFASGETLARTERTLAGPQHPSYDINLTGTGDLVLTDLREGVERIAFSESLDGRVSIRDGGGRLVLEMRKTAGSPVVIALPPGSYRISLDDGTDLRGATIYLSPGAEITIDQANFQRLYRERAVTRGNGPEIDEGMNINFMAINERPMNGMQIGVIGAINEGGMEGMQIASIFTITEGPMQGIQLAGIFNIVEGELFGPQLAGVFNIVEGNVEGPQLAGVFNITEGRLEGPQIAGVFNIAEGEKTTGIQIAGTFNIADNMEGSQIGVVNIAGKMQGVQAGIVNICDDLQGVPIGLINICGNGLHHLSAWYDGNGLVNTGFQLGTFYYTFFTAALDPEDPDRLLTAGIGMGAEMPIGPFYLDTELYAKSLAAGNGSFEENAAVLFSEQTVPIPAVRLSFGRKFDGWKGGKSSVFGGVDLALCFRGYTEFVPEIMGAAPWSLRYSENGDFVDIYPTWFFGMRF